MDKSIVIESIKNSVNASIVKVETLFEFVTPASVVVEKKEVE